MTLRPPTWMMRAAVSKEMLSIDFRLQRGSELRDHGMYDFALAFDHTLGFMPDAELHQHFVHIRSALKDPRSFLLVQASTGRAQNCARSQRSEDSKLDRT